MSLSTVALDGFLEVLLGAPDACPPGCGSLENRTVPSVPQILTRFTPGSAAMASFTIDSIRA